MPSPGGLYGPGQDHRRRLTHYQCLNCGSIYSRRPSRAGSYCSPACAHEATRQDTTVRYCATCTCVLYRRTKYCSNTCRYTPTHISLVCPECDKDFVILKHRIALAPLHFCSQSCANRHNRHQQIAQASKQPNARILLYQKVSQSIAAWSRVLGIKAGTLRNRLNKLEWDIEKTLTTPPQAPTIANLLRGRNRPLDILALAERPHA